MEENEFNLLEIIRLGFCSVCSDGVKLENDCLRCHFGGMPYKPIDEITSCGKWPRWYDNFKELKFIISIKENQDESTNSV